MWISDMVDQSATNGMTVMVAEAPQRGAGAAPTAKKAFGVCSTIRVDSHMVYPVFSASTYMYKYHGVEQFDTNDAKTRIVQQPKNGSLNLTERNYSYQYIPNPSLAFNPEGNFDSFVIEVEKGGVKVEIHYLIYVFTPEDGDYDMCKLEEWKISLPSQTTDDPNSWAYSSPLSVLLYEAHSALTGFSNLPSPAVAQTTGSYSSGQITLDTNAAGWGWYIDPTPLDNTDDYLPTADPNIWKAKPGSGAEGKMDMLSVLLHEYGHILGLQHSADPRNFMATTLQPGERRLPSAAELQLMAELVAQIKAEQLAYTPLPGLPPAGGGKEELPIGFAIPAFLAPRRNEGSMAATTNYLGVVNPTLMDGDFGSLNGWLTRGDVSVADNTVTLTESPTAQTQLLQGFMLGENDRVLSFTITAQNLIRNASGPGDAFEVALLDANTGLPVVGAIDLTRSDALLNIQTDGNERMAQGVSKVVNLDGSATYSVALPESLIGTPVLLSFDLLGFGFGDDAAKSSITLADVSLLADVSFAPIARDDNITLDEDTVANGNVLTNDSTDGTAIAYIETMREPAHGSLILADDGSFTYTPEPDFNGNDSFTYRLVDVEGRISNTATVNITVLPVNDAPVSQNAALELDEDDTLVIDLLAYAYDVDGDTLQATVITQPTHGTLTANADGSFTYTPEPDYNGSDSFTWLANDGQLASNIATISLTIRPVNDAPIAPDDRSIVMMAGQSYAFDPLEGASDVDNDPLFVVWVEQPAHGSLIDNGDGTFIYTANLDYVGADRIIWRVSDGELESANTATLSITVNAAKVSNTAPVANDANLSLYEDGELLIDLSALAYDADGDVLQTSIITQPTHGTLVRQSDGHWLYTPRPYRV